MRILDSTILKKIEIIIGKKKRDPLWKNKIPKSASVATLVTSEVARVSPKHFPIIIDSHLMDLGMMR